MTDTATITPMENGTNTQPLTPRQTIRATWVNYVGNTTYDVTRAAVDFFLEGVLKELSVYAKTTSPQNNTVADKFKGLLLSFTHAVRPKTLALSNAIGSATAYLSKQIIGNLIGQIVPHEKVEAYNLDAKNRGAFNRATTQFARDNVKYMALGALSFMGAAQPLLATFAPQFNLLLAHNSTLVNLLTGAGLGLAGNQTLPRLYHFVVSKLPAKTTEPTVPTTTSVDTTIASDKTNVDAEKEVVNNLIPQTKLEEATNLINTPIVESGEGFEGPQAVLFTPSFSATDTSGSLTSDHNAATNTPEIETPEEDNLKGSTFIRKRHAKK